MPTSSLRAASRRKVCASLMFALLCASGFAAAGDDTRAASSLPSGPALRKQDTRMKIQMTVDGTVIATATLDNNDSARDFAAMLPLNLTLKDYAATEKIADLPRKLSIKGASESYKPAAGDISYFAPWGNLAIFYKDGHLSSGLVRLGRLDSGLDAMRRNGPTAVRLERVRPRHRAFQTVTPRRRARPGREVISPARSTRADGRRRAFADRPQPGARAAPAHRSRTRSRRPPGRDRRCGRTSGKWARAASRPA